MENNDRNYLDQVHKDGKIWNFTMSAIFIAFPIVLCIIFRTLPNWQGLIKGLVATLPMYWAVGIIEVVTYFPMLGSGGAYLSFVTGNISNLKLPCALNAMEQAKVTPQSEEGEIISTIAIAISSIVTTLIIALGVILIVPLNPILNSKQLEPAFNMLLPALFGGLGVVFVSKNWKISIAPIILMLILFISIPMLNASTVGIMVPVSAVFTIAFSRLMYKKGWLGTNEPNTQDFISNDTDSNSSYAE